MQDIRLERSSRINPRVVDVSHREIGNGLCEFPSMFRAERLFKILLQDSISKLSQSVGAAVHIDVETVESWGDL